MTEMGVFYKNFDRILKVLEVTKKELAERLGVYRQTIGKWQKQGETGPIPPYWALRYVIENEILPEKDESVCEIYRHLLKYPAE